MELQEKQSAASNWFRELRNCICREFEKIEEEFSGLSSAKFERKPWDRDGGGGGEISMLKGRVFEKVGVNISTVYGKFAPEFAKEIPGAAEGGGEFWASGISLVAHMRSPLIPAVHMNTRFISTAKSWFGGGADLTPMYPNEQDTKAFHNALEECCTRHDSGYYQKFKKQCDEYFFLKHRGEPRGIGGIFYDYLDSGNFENDFAFTRDVGETFLKIYSGIVRCHMNEKWTEEQREYQLKKRGRYVEFNLLYDRGTRFGIQTGGNPEAVLMSLPPLVSWE